MKIGLALFLGGMISLGACYPKGKVPEKPKTYTKIKDSDASQGRSGKANLNFFKEGLPSFCSLGRQSKAEACIYCKPEDLTLQRCFKSAKLFDPQKSCTHDREKLKCLVPDSVSVVKLSFYDNQEKEFLKNLPVVINTIKIIANSSLDLNNKDNALFFAVLDFIDHNIFDILSAQKSTEMGRELRRLFEAKGGADVSRQVEKAFIDGVSVLQAESRAGNLDITDGLTFTASIVRKFSKSQEVAKIMDTINLEGLLNNNG